jgi:DNA-binding XRE family transcriptional regulator
MGVNGPDTVAILLTDLGRQLAALRREAGLTQHGLATRVQFSRTTVSLAEIGYQANAREFWVACDQALGTGGVLAAGHDEITAVREAQQRAAARTAQEARQARALAAFTEAERTSEVTTAVTAVQPCPRCGHSLTVLTTVVPSEPEAAASSPQAGPDIWEGGNSARLVSQDSSGSLA